MNLDTLSLGERIRLIARLAAAEHVRQEIDNLHNLPTKSDAPKAKLPKVGPTDPRGQREAA